MSNRKISMPWTSADADKHKKGLSPRQKSAWAKIANSTLKSCLNKGGERSACEGKAIRIANDAVDKVGKEGDFMAKASTTIKMMDGKHCIMRGAEKVKCYDTHEEAMQNKELLDEAEELLTKEEAHEKGWVPWGVKSWEELDEARKAEHMQMKARDFLSDFSGLMRNVFDDGQMSLAEKATSLRVISEKFLDRVEAASKEEKTDSMHHPTAPEYATYELDKEADPEDENSPAAWYEYAELIKEADLTESETELATKAVWSTKFVNDLPNSSFAYVEPDCKIKSCRHLPYKDASGKVDLPHLRNAIARAPQVKGISAEKKASIQARLRKILASHSKEREDESFNLIAQLKQIIKPLLPAQPDSEFMLWKEADESYRWLAVYSNNFIDDDRPPDIISESSHVKFVDQVESKQAEMPELWLWHVPEWRIGVADWIAWDDVGFSLASGSVDRGKEAVAEWLGKQRDVAVSHGMPISSIKRDPHDPSVIVEHLTKEISPLPRWAAANKRTGFVMLGTPDDNKETPPSDMTSSHVGRTEDDPMAIPAKKKEELISKWNADPQLLEQLEQLNAITAAKAQAEGIKSKEEEGATEDKPAEPKTETSLTDTPAEDKTDTPETETPLTREEVAEVLVPMQKQVADLVAAVVQLSETVKELKSDDDQKIDKQVSSIPAASLAGLLAQRMSAIGSSEAQISGKEKLAKDKPQEAKADQGAFGIPFLDKLVSDNGGQTE